MKATTAEIAKFIESHGNKVTEITDTTVTFELPWYIPATGKSGVDTVTVSSLSGAKAELGY